MKQQPAKAATYKTMVTLLLLNIFQVMAWAQESSVSTSTTTTTTESQGWYMQPWAWVVGGAVLLLIIAALVRGSGSGKSSTTDKVTYTKTTEKGDTP